VKKESQVRTLMVCGILGSLAGYVLFLGLLFLGVPVPWASACGYGVVATAIGSSFYGLWTWEVYRKKKHRKQFQPRYESAAMGESGFPEEFAESAARIHSASTPAKYIRAGERAMAEEAAGPIIFNATRCCECGGLTDRDSECDACFQQKGIASRVDQIVKAAVISSAKTSAALDREIDAKLDEIQKG